ncbi:hypothetical protein GWK47_015489 [Chionoecetes opilio]|uniref:Uncharacterized protein n=1 Tax=Chionoecetes opilio TaxID=41210 RepID=A0A8J5CMY9_CHIOP|nr:hypothetical protein GWK47_015489 [Chionoecetes opilio]
MDYSPPFGLLTALWITHHQAATLPGGNTAMAVNTATPATQAGGTTAMAQHCHARTTAMAQHCHARNTSRWHHCHGVNTASPATYCRRHHCHGGNTATPATQAGGTTAMAQHCHARNTSRRPPTAMAQTLPRPQHTSRRHHCHGVNTVSPATYCRRQHCHGGNTATPAKTAGGTTAMASNTASPATYCRRHHCHGGTHCHARNTAGGTTAMASTLPTPPRLTAGGTTAMAATHCQASNWSPQPSTSNRQQKHQQHRSTNQRLVPPPALGNICHLVEDMADEAHLKLVAKKRKLKTKRDVVLTCIIHCCNTKGTSKFTPLTETSYGKIKDACNIRKMHGSDFETYGHIIKDIPDEYLNHAMGDGELSFTCTDFNLARGDYLDVSYNNDHSTPCIPRYRYDDGPEVTSTEGGALRLFFKTNRAEVASGFDCTRQSAEFHSSWSEQNGTSLKIASSTHHVAVAAIRVPPTPYPTIQPFRAW